VVVDAATALALCFPDEGSDYADCVPVSLKGKTLLVPSIWSLEITNAIQVGASASRRRSGSALRLTSTLNTALQTQEVSPSRIVRMIFSLQPQPGPSVVSGYLSNDSDNTHPDGFSPEPSRPP
jgi:hypothetical protein